MSASSPQLDAERRASIAGVAAAPTLLLLALLVGLVEGGLLPTACQGLACLYSALVSMAVAGILVVWLLVWFVLRLTRRRWPRSNTRLWLLRLLAVLSWGPVLWLVVTAIE